MPEPSKISRRDLITALQVIGLDAADLISLTIRAALIVAEVLERDDNGDIIVRDGHAVTHWQGWEVVD